MDGVERKVTVYDSDDVARSWIVIWKEMLAELIVYRELVWRLMSRDISSRYKQSMFGILWAFLSPLAMLFAFVWAKDRNILPIGNTEMPYAIFVFIGQMIWLVFSSGITLAGGSLVSASSLLTKISFPREVLVIAALGQSIFEFLVRLPLLLLLFIWFGYQPKPTIILVPLMLLPLILLTVGLGFIVALFNAMIRDVGSIIGIVVSIGMFATPVIYPPPSSWPLSLWVNYINPVSAFIAASRDLISVGHVNDIAGYTLSATGGIIVFLLGWRLFHLVEPKIAERI